jgi:hypothetical protein
MATFGDEWRRGRHSDHDAARGLTHTVCVYILATFPGCSPQWRRETRISGLPAWVCADFGASRPWVPNSVDLGCLLPNTPISGLPPESAPTLDSFPFLIELKSCDIWFTTTKNQTGVRPHFDRLHVTVLPTVWRREGSAPGAWDAAAAGTVGRGRAAACSPRARQWCSARSTNGVVRQTPTDRAWLQHMAAWLPEPLSVSA